MRLNDSVCGCHLRVVLLMVVQMRVVGGFNKGLLGDGGL